jgi:antitoxin component YwqK of YwqJK toxin-antitoxin module
VEEKLMRGGSWMARIVNMTLRNNVVATYEGQVKDGKPQGFGSAYYRSGGRYEGEWKDGNRCGQGKEYYPDGTLRYEGEWQHGVRSGQGKSYYTDGTLAYEGKWINDRPEHFPKSTSF